MCRDAAMMGVRRILDEARKKGLNGEAIQQLLKEQVNDFPSQLINGRCENRVIVFMFPNR